MLLFWVICVLFVVIALAFVLPPLLDKKADSGEGDRRAANIAVYQDQIAELEADLQNGIISNEQYQQDREEIEGRLLEDVAPKEKRASAKVSALSTNKAPLYSVALGLPVLAVVLYLNIGNRQAIHVSRAPASPATAGSQPANAENAEQQRIERNVQTLADRLQQNPNDAEGWAMLAKSYQALERYSDASAAYEKATVLKPDDADLLADHAFVLAMASGRQLSGKPAEILKKALELDPENPKALQLGGSAAFEAGNYQQAITLWQKLLARTPPESELGQALAQQIEEARTRAGQNTK